ncbi:adenylate/guanylate cyclase domain-containing protein [Mesorhizobium sangaii]|uniref:Class 3 adenylate cyclase/CHASE3 domain sensor protein/putative methionine-R-sulfoxide reductase with GAF domain n=1 Tax=Mesorhizobium sangaii TaxID=505389 RepID=A0A841PDT9_9HYPH|nr:adenylate/guanylate cyclase domain-containing protein [Mesorhizobium sangaii]MBB6411921.1 class 3 adenylate cyclase/CHASE3 domain sensor protein/putative methionine-R-sulfoxide reductase with GAF domain [Mesorhizobium sangaii]
MTSEDPVIAKSHSVYLAPWQKLTQAVAPALRKLNIGGKLTVGFGILVALMLLVVGLNYLGSIEAVLNINRTTNLSAPSAVASARAQANLLRMLGEVRGYLALGDESYRDGYRAANEAFLSDMHELDVLLRAKGESVAITGSSSAELGMQEIAEQFSAWQPLPEQLFDLRDDQLRREPALKILVMDANPLIGNIVASAKGVMLAQQNKEPSPANTALLVELASFQTSFYAMVAGLRGYVTTGRDSFKYEYEANLTINETAWSDIAKSSTVLSRNQNALIEKITKSRAAFLELPARMFEAVEGEHAREDLYLFRTQAVPIAERMLALLDKVATQEQRRLQIDLGSGRDQLEGAQRIILSVGAAAVLLGLLLGLIFRESIAGPVQRLTNVADRVRRGDLAARAQIESGDEIGTLATTFNSMTVQLGANLGDLENRRKEQENLARRFRRQSDYLGALHDTSLGLIARLDLAELLSDLTARAAQLLGTEHGYVYLVDESGEALERRVGVGVYTTHIGQKLSRSEGVAGAVWHTGEALLINDYQNWSGRAAAAAQLDVTIRAIMGVPLKSGEMVVGVLGIAYDDASALEFGEEEVELLKRFGQLASIALENARLHMATGAAKQLAEEASKRVGEQNRMLESLSSKLSKYLSPQVYASIFSGRQNVEISSKRKKLTVFFSDIADFTSTTDKLESEELTGLLNHYLTEMTKIALEHGATVDKYIGDAILAFFGDPESKGTKEDALACVRMAIAMQRRMQGLHAEWANAGAELPFQLRMGINTGYCTVGNFGSEDRMDYTIIGGEVNLASRLQAHADLGGILLAHETYALVKDEIEAEELPPLAIKGFSHLVPSYRVLGIREDQPSGAGVVCHIQKGLRLEVDVATLDSDSRAEAIKLLEEAIETLRK